MYVCKISHVDLMIVHGKLSCFNFLKKKFPMLDLDIEFEGRLLILIIIVLCEERISSGKSL